MKKSFLAIAVATSLSSYASNSLAETTAVKNSTDNDTLVVTANRFEQKQSSVLASTSVITRKDIELLQVDNALDVLKTLAGVEVVSSGSKAHDTSIYIRGTNTEHALVMVDGVKVNSLTSGGSSIGLIPAFAIEQIEVIRGPRAAAFGSDALGGVINITTTTDYASHHEAFLGYGSQNHGLMGWKSVGEINETTKAELIVSQEKSDGHKIASNAAEGMDYGYESQTIVGHVQHEVNDNLMLQLSAMQITSDYDYYSDTTSKNNSENTSQILSGIAKYISDSFYSSELQLSSYFNEGKVGKADGSTTREILETRKNVVSWLNGFDVVELSHIQLGIEYTESKAQRLGAYSSNYNGTSKNKKSAFITSSSDFDTYTFDLSARYDNSSSFGVHSTWNTGIGYRLTDDIELIGSYGTGYREPTFNDLYWPGQGNPDLQPETSESREIEIRGDHQLLEWSVALYRNDIDNLIAWKNTTGTWLPYNVDRARIDGLELKLEFDTWDVNHRIQASWKDPKDSSDGSLLSRRAQNNYSWTMLYQGDDWSGSWVTNYVGSRISGSRWLDSYITVDAAIKYKVTNQLTAGVKIDNLFDETVRTGYSSSYGYYLGDERTVFASLNYLF